MYSVNLWGILLASNLKAKSAETISNPIFYCFIAHVDAYNQPSSSCTSLSSLSLHKSSQSLCSFFLEFYPRFELLTDLKSSNSLNLRKILVGIWWIRLVSEIISRHVKLTKDQNELAVDVSTSERREPIRAPQLY